ncbi:MAG: hypothetical protein ACREOH_17635, partial [Candidatus Entotheonellia bacterium]
LTVIVAAVFLLVLAGVSYLIWSRDANGALIGKPEDGIIMKPEKGIIIMWVPISILEWAFAGAMVSVLYRLAYRKSIQRVDLELYTWAIAKPIIGLFMGALVYFLALAGAKLLDGSPEALKNALWLNVVAFVGGFSDELSVGLINRFVRRRLGADGNSNE